MDDAHIYCRPDQVEEEVEKILRVIAKFYALFNFEPRYVLATRPEKALGEKEDWDSSENALENALKNSGLKYTIEKGEGAFYGPKIEVHLKDSQDRDWQLGTAQLDLVMLPKQFEVSYIDENGKKQMPWVIHRAVFGSFERILGVLLEHFDGKLPLWLSPVQAEILTITDKQNQYGEKVLRELKKSGIRVKLNTDNATIGKKIREAEIRRVPYLLIVGEKEAGNNTVAVRHYTKGDLKEMAVDKLADSIKKEIQSRN
jgi:threonyl-tRNA synthetase